MRANAFVDKGYFSRTKGKHSPFEGLLYDSRGRMTWAEGPVDCARQVIAIALGSSAAKSPILDRYCAMTDADKSVLEEFWKVTGNIRGEKQNVGAHS